MEESLHKKALVIAVWRGNTPGDVKILLLRRPQGSRDYAWQPITGNGEPGEDFPQIAAREALEETKLRFREEPRALGLTHRFLGRFGEVEEAAFAWEVLESTAPPAPSLDPKEHDSYLWLSPKEAWAKLPFAHQREAVLVAAAPPAPLVLNADGTWWQDGEEITHERTIGLLRQSLNSESLPNGLIYHHVSLGQETAPVIVRDTAEFINKVDLARGEVLLLFQDRWVPVDPTDFEIGGENVLYAEIKGLRARFLRPAYYELAKHLHASASADGSVEYSLDWRGNRHRLFVSR